MKPSFCMELMPNISCRPGLIKNWWPPVFWAHATGFIMYLYNFLRYLLSFGASVNLCYEIGSCAYRLGTPFRDYDWYSTVWYDTYVDPKLDGTTKYICDQFVMSCLFYTLHHCTQWVLSLSGVLLDSGTNDTNQSMTGLKFNWNWICFA